MPLLLMDLDDTLIDRTGAFRRGVVDLLAGYGLPADDVDWVMELDARGETSRDALAAAMLDRYGLALTVAALAAELRRRVVERVRLAEDTRRALERATTAGWVPVIVTNGAQDQQEAKIEAVGLDALVAGWVTSGGAGIAKPDPEIFRTAARLAGRSLDGAWMVGDNPEKDIAGAAALGLAAVWLALGRAWPDAVAAPGSLAYLDEYLLPASCSTREVGIRLGESWKPRRRAGSAGPGAWVSDGSRR